MFLRALNFIKTHIWAISFAFMAAITLNVFYQIYTHTTTTLTPWKGGGFGMYTEPHSDSRTVWIRIRGVDTNGYEISADVRLYPKTALMRQWQNAVSRGGSQSLQRLTNAAESLRFYPNDTNMGSLAEFASRIRWPEDAVGKLQPMNGNSFAARDITVLVAEKYVDIHNQQVGRRVIAEYPPQSQQVAQ